VDFRAASHRARDQKLGALRASSSVGNLPLPGTLTKRSKPSKRLQEASKSYQERSFKSAYSLASLLCSSSLLFMRKAYQADLSNAEWTFLEPLMPIRKTRGGPKIHSSPDILDHQRGDELPDGQAFASLMRLCRQFNFVASQ
jgi:hypothetical protein